MRSQRVAVAIGAAIITTLSAAAAVAAAAAPNSSRSDGEFVRAEYEDPVTGTYENFEVITNTTSGPSLVTYLLGYRNTCDEAGCTGVMVYGQIPNHDFSCTGNHAELRTMIARTSALEVSAWRHDFATDSYTELDPPSGLVDITWQRSGDGTETGQGTFVQTDENFTFRSQGYMTARSATAMGTFLGQAVPTTGLIGTTRSYAKSIVRNRP